MVSILDCVRKLCLTVEEKAENILSGLQVWKNDSDDSYGGMDCGITGNKKLGRCRKCLELCLDSQPEQRANTGE